MRTALVVGTVDLSQTYGIIFDTRDHDRLGNAHRFLAVGNDEGGRFVVEPLSFSRPTQAAEPFIRRVILRHARGGDLFAGYQRGHNYRPLQGLFYHAYFGVKDAKKRADLRAHLRDRPDFGAPTPVPEVDAPAGGRRVGAPREL